MSWSGFRQKIVHTWATTRFGLMNASDAHERGLRVLEETIELCQALNISPTEIGVVVGHVYQKPEGRIAQELAGVGVTLLAFAEAIGLDFCDVVDDEINRIHELPIDHFRDRHQLKADAGIAMPPEAR